MTANEKAPYGAFFIPKYAVTANLTEPHKFGLF